MWRSFITLLFVMGRILGAADESLVSSLSDLDMFIGERHLETEGPLLIETCRDVPKFFSSARTGDPVEFYETYLDCTCSGDFKSFFTFDCKLKDKRCFQEYVPLSEGSFPEAGSPSYCATTRNVLDFLVRTDENGNPQYLPNGQQQGTVKGVLRECFVEQR